MAETPPNTPQHVHIAAQQHERSNQTLDSPQTHQTAHQAIAPLIQPLHFNVPPPPVVVPGDDPFAVPAQVAPVHVPVQFNGHQYRHLPQNLTEALQNFAPLAPGGQGQG